MKSIILATLEYPGQKGGVATYLANLVACFPKGSVQVLAPEDPASHDIDMLSDAPIYRRNLLLGWIRPRWLGALYWTDWLRKKERAELLIVSHLLPMGLVARILKRRRGLPYVVIVHGMDVALALKAGGPKRARAKAVLAGAQMVVANSVHTAQLAEALGATRDKIAIVRPSPGFPLDIALPSDRVEAVRKFYAMPAGYTLLSVGRLVERKGFAEAIQAAALLKQEGRQVHLVIAGDGPQRQKLEALAKSQDVADRVSFLGRVPDEDLPGLYAAANAFVMAPKSIGADVEGFGIVYLEANLMGRPVIGSRTGGVADAVVDGKTGLLVEPGSAAAIAEAVRKLMDDSALAERLGADGRKRVQEDFGWKRQAGGLVEALMKTEAKG